MDAFFFQDQINSMLDKVLFIQLEIAAIYTLLAIITVMHHRWAMRVQNLEYEVQRLLGDKYEAQLETLSKERDRLLDKLSSHED